MVLRGCGPRGYPGHARGRQHAAAGQAPRPGRRRHGAHQRRPHERHRVRHDGAARRPGVDGRRTVGTRSHGRHDHARRAGAAGSPSTSTTTSSTVVAPSGGRRRPWPSAAGTASTSITSRRPTPAATSTSSSAPAVRRSPREPLTSLRSPATQAVAGRSFAGAHSLAPVAHRVKSRAGDHSRVSASPAAASVRVDDLVVVGGRHEPQPSAGRAHAEVLEHLEEAGEQRPIGVGGEVGAGAHRSAVARNGSGAAARRRGRRRGDAVASLADRAARRRDAA